MKWIKGLIMTMALGTVFLLAAFAPQKAQAKEVYKTFDDIYVEQDQIYYKVDNFNHVSVIGATVKTDVLKIPSAITLDDGTKCLVNCFEYQEKEAFDSSTTKDDINFSTYKDIIVPDSLMYMDLSYGFKHITVAKHATIHINSYFYGKNDVTIDIPSNHEFYVCDKNLVYDKKNKKKIVYILKGRKNVVIPKGVTSVGRLCNTNEVRTIKLPSTCQEIGYSFARNSSVRSVDMSKTKMKEIPRAAFMGCKNLSTVKMPKNITEISEHSFESCKKLEKITIGKKVDTIHVAAFRYAGIKSIVIPANVRHIKPRAFCSKSLKKVTFKNKKKLPSFPLNEWSSPFASRFSSFCGELKNIHFYTASKKTQKRLQMRMKKAGEKKCKISLLS